MYALDFAMQDLKDSITGKKITISGSGNVAQFAAEKCLELGGIVLTLSDSSGTIYEVCDDLMTPWHRRRHDFFVLLQPNGFDSVKLKQLVAIKKRRGRCKEYTEVSNTAQ